MRLKRFLLPALLLCSFLSGAQIRNYNYRFNIRGLKENDTIYLANYLGRSLYYFDTAYVHKGTFAFKNSKNLPPGQYAVVWGAALQLDLILNEPAFVISGDTGKLMQEIRIEGSEENRIFYEYLRYLKTKRDELAPLQTLLDSAKTEEEKTKYRSKIAELDKHVKAYQEKLSTDHAQLLVGRIVGLSKDISVPEPPKNPDGSVDSTWKYYYYRNHYFDLVDFQDEALARSPAFFNKVDYFYNQVVPVHPDSICETTRQLTSKMDPKGDMFKFVVTYVVENFNKSDRIGIRDGVFVCMADQFFLAGKAFWLDTAKLSKIKETVGRYRPLLIGKKISNISLPDTTLNRWHKLYNIDKPYVAVVFWDPECGHCKKEMPKLAEFYNSDKDKHYEIYSISPDDSQKWKDFIIANNLRFMNVAVPAVMRNDPYKRQIEIDKGNTTFQSINVLKEFDIYAYPKVFVLDKEHKILYKEIGIEQLIEILKDLGKDKK